MDPVTLGMAKSYIGRLFGSPAASSPPAGLTWPAQYALTATLVDQVPGTMRGYGTTSITAESVFNAKSTALSAPGSTLYVSQLTGNDTTGTGAIGSHLKSIWKAIAVANTGGVPTKIIVDGSSGANQYYRANNPWFNGGTGIAPTVDIALLATNGRVYTGTYEPPGTPTLDATYTNCYSWSVTGANRVCDMRNLNRFGNYTDLTYLATAALCNATPDSWALVSNVLYVNRKDRVAVSNYNTRLFRQGTATISFTNPVNIYVGGVTPGDGFDFEGGNAGSVFSVGITSGLITTTHKALVVKNCSFRYGGGVVDTGTNGISVSSWQGIVWVENCRADENQTDGFNFHNGNSATSMSAITLNCSASNNGRPVVSGGGNYSNNGWTCHEDMQGIDIAGHYRDTHGGAVHNIGTSRMWAFGTLIENEMGDQAWQGTIPPTCFRASESATIWCERTKIAMPGAGLAYVALLSTNTIHKRNVWPTPLRDSGAGTIDTF